MTWRTLLPGWLWRLWVASMVVALLIWLTFLGAWIYVRHGHEALEQWFERLVRDPVRVPTQRGGAYRG